MFEVTPRSAYSYKFDIRIFFLSLYIALLFKHKKKIFTFVYVRFSPKVQSSSGSLHTSGYEQISNMNECRFHLPPTTADWQRLILLRQLESLVFVAELCLLRQKEAWLWCKCQVQQVDQKVVMKSHSNNCSYKSRSYFWNRISLFRHMYGHEFAVLLRLN